MEEHTCDTCGETFTDSQPLSGWEQEQCDECHAEAYGKHQREEEGLYRAGRCDLCGAYGPCRCEEGMGKIEVYGFEDTSGQQCGFTTYDIDEARQHAEEHGLKVIAYIYEFSDSELVNDYTKQEEEE